MLSFEDYINLLSELADAKITTNKDKFFSVLNLARENAKEADKKVLASLPNNIYLPVKYKKEKFANVITACVDDYSLAMQDMKDPEKFAAILSILNDKLAKDGDVYDISTPETEMLGLANRYANNARECQYARQWKLFAFYMRSLAYFIPQLIHKANLEEEKVLTKIEAKLKLIANDGECPICHCNPCECDDYGDDVSPSGLTADAKPNLKGADIINYKGYTIAEWPTGRLGLTNIKIALPDGTFVGGFKTIREAKFYIDSGKIKKHKSISKTQPGLPQNALGYVEMKDKDIKDLKKWVKDHHYDVKAFEKFTKDELKKAWDLMLEHNKDQRDLEEWFMFLVG